MTAPTAPTERKTYTDEFRRAAVDLVSAEKLTVAAAARRLGVNPEVLRKWKRRYAPAPVAPGPDAQSASAAAPDLAAEVRRLREQVRQLTMDREILKKAATFFARESA